MHRYRTLAIALFALSPALSACHTYRPISTATPGTAIRVHVPVVSALSNPNAPPQSVSIEGDVVSAGDTVVLATETRRELGAYREVVQFDTVRLAPDQRLSMELVEFSTKKSVLLGVAIAGGATAFAVAAFGFGGGSDGGGPNNTPPQPAIVISGSLIGSILGWVGR